MNDAISVRHAVETDLDAVLAIEHQAPTAAHWARAVYVAVISAEATAQPLRTFFVAECGGNVVGFVVAQAVSTPSHGTECEMENIVVVAGVRRSGIGSALLLSVCEWARALGAVQLRAEVRDSNLAAREFYARAGFTQTATRPSYYRDPVEDALLLTLHL